MSWMAPACSQHKQTFTIQAQLLTLSIRSLQSLQILTQHSTQATAPTTVNTGTCIPSSVTTIAHLSIAALNRHARDPELT